MDHNKYDNELNHIFIKKIVGKCTDTDYKRFKELMAQYQSDLAWETTKEKIKIKGLDVIDSRI